MFEMLLTTAVLPTVAAMLAAWGAHRGLGTDGSLRAGALAVLAALAIGFPAGMGWPLPIEASYQWVFWGGVAAAALALVLPRRLGPFPPDGAALPAVAALAFVPIAHFMVQALVPRYWSVGHAWGLVVGIGAAVVLTAWAAGHTARRIRAVRLAPAWTLWATGASLTLFAGGSARMAQSVGLLAAAAGGLMTLSWLRPGFAWFRRAAPPTTVVIGLAALNLYGYGDQADPMALALLALPPMLWMLWVHRPGARQAGTATEIVVLLLATALPLAWAATHATQALSADDYGYSY